MADQFVGKWNFKSSENFDAYLESIGVGFMLRKVAATTKPTLTIEINGDEWTITSVSTFKTHVTKFKLGQEVELSTIDGRDVTAKFELDGSKLIQTEKGKNGGQDSRIERSVNGNTLTIVAQCKDVKSTRVYEKA